MEIYTIGGFEEVGKNMTVIRTGEDVFIFDMLSTFKSPKGSKLKIFLSIN